MNAFRIPLWALASGIVVFLLGPGCGSHGQITNQSGTGNMAHQFLASDAYTSLLVEIQAVRGYEPTTDAQSRLQQFLTDHLNKPGGIQIVVDPDITSPGKSTFSVSDVQAIESANRVHQSSGSQIVAYFLFLDGDSSSDTQSVQMLGQAYGSTSVVIYEKAVRDNSGGGPLSQEPPTNILEATVMEHEFGHLLGLVNLGSTPQSDHQDVAHGAHCSVSHCLMDYVAETSGILTNLLGGNVPALDAQCEADLRANGGK